MREKRIHLIHDVQGAVLPTKTLAVATFRGMVTAKMTNERIEINPRVCGGQPVVKGTRISIATLLEQLREEESWDSLLKGYPELSRQDIQAALEYARQSILHTHFTELDAA